MGMEYVEFEIKKKKTLKAAVKNSENAAVKSSVKTKDKK